MSIIIKTEQEIDGIRKSCHLAADTLDWLEQFVVPGVTTNYIDQQAEKFIRDHGAVPATLGYHGYPKSCCTSLNEVICHGIPSDTDVLKEGDILNIDVTTILNGYFGDTCRMFPVGKVSDAAQKIMAVSKDCLDLAIVQVKPKNPFWKIGKAIQDYAHSRGCSVVYQFVGHGTGLKFHEEPNVRHYYDETEREERLMQPGMIFTIEPMINLGLPEAVVDKADKWTARTIDGSLSAQYEHTVLVTETGVEVLTSP